MPLTTERANEILDQLEKHFDNNDQFTSMLPVNDGSGLNKLNIGEDYCVEYKAEEMRFVFTKGDWCLDDGRLTEISDHKLDNNKFSMSNFVLECCGKIEEITDMDEAEELEAWGHPDDEIDEDEEQW